MSDSGSPPSGTVTFLFTDVEGSTRLWEEHPVEMQLALERHDEILRSSIEGHGGYVFSTAGDAFSASFGRAGDAVEAAVAAQRRLSVESWPEATKILVRMGVHTGEAQERGGDYFGTALNRAARTMGLGAGGQILMSAATAELVDVGRRSEGVCELRGLAERVEVFSVLAEGLQTGFPPLRAAATLGNLPPESLELVGREDLIEDLVTEVKGARLVTLVGPGGIGKTSVAVELARRVEELFPAGVWLVELAPVRDPEAVVAALGSAIGARSGGGGETLLDAALGLLSSEPALVVIDNCEHLAEPAADVVQAVLAGSSATVVATSRAPLHLRDEHVRHVPPLAAGGARSDAVRLFVERARQVRDDFALNDTVAGTIAEICQLVDGMPLAVELAAARCRSMSPTDVLIRLERDAGKVLRDARRDGQERQRTLQATIEWSHELLSLEEQGLFARLSVFAGSFDLEAAEAVCAGGEVDEFDVVDLVDALVDQSLVSLAGQTSTVSRYRLLEPIRQFAEQRVVDGESWRERHAVYYGGLAELAYEAMWTGAEAKWIERLEADFANQRVAYQFWADWKRLTEALTIAITLNQVGELVLQRPAGAEVLFSALQLDGVEAHELGPIVMAHSAAAMARRQDTRALPLAERALELASTPLARWETSTWAIITAAMLGDAASGRTLVEQWSAQAPEIDLPRVKLLTGTIKAYSALLDGDLAAAAELLASVPPESPSALLQAFLHIAHVSYAESNGDYQHALELALDTAERGRANGNRWAVGQATLAASFAATKVLEPSELLRLLSQSIPEWRQANDLGRLGGCFPYVAHGLANLGNDRFAAKLLGANTPHSLTRTNPRDQQLRDQLAEDLRRRIGDDEFVRLESEGYNTPIRTLADEALRHIDRYR